MSSTDSLPLALVRFYAPILTVDPLLEETGICLPELLIVASQWDGRIAYPYQARNVFGGITGCRFAHNSFFVKQGALLLRSVIPCGVILTTAFLRFKPFSLSARVPSPG